MRLRLGIGLGIILALTIAAIFLPVGRLAMELVTWVRGAGALGVIVYAIVYIVALVLFVPGVPLAVASGFVLGPVGGPLLALPAVVIGGSLSFLLGRTLFRPAAARKLAEYPRLAAIDERLAQQGFRVALLLRLAPVIPFNVVNLALSATRMTFRDYVLGTMLGAAPWLVFMGHVGAGLSDATQLAGRASGGFRGPALWIAIGVSAVVLGVLTLVLRRALVPRAHAPRVAPDPDRGAS